MAFKKTTTKGNEMSYQVMEECGTIAIKGDWEMKLRYISWAGRDPKYDVRYWSTDDTGKEICKKGLTLTTEEIEGLQKLLNEIN